MKNLFHYFLNFLDNNLQQKNLKIIKKHLKNKINVYVDVGAHNGEMIKIITKEFIVNKVLAFEPNPDCFLRLKKLKKNNKLSIFKLALSDKRGFDYLKIGHISSMSTLNNINNQSNYTKLKKIIMSIFYFDNKIYKKRIKIKKDLLSSILSKSKIIGIDLLKIDTEGHEFNVLKGAKNFLKNINLLLFEFHYDNSIIKKYDYEEVNNFLKKNNFILIAKNKMILRKGYELIYKNRNYIKK
jgi:FkbM family methyltransferase